MVLIESTRNKTTPIHFSSSRHSFPQNCVLRSSHCRGVRLVTILPTPIVCFTTSFPKRMSSLSLKQSLPLPIKRVGRGQDSLQYQGKQRAWQCTFSHDGTYLAVCFGAPDPLVRIWKYTTTNATTKNDGQQQQEKCWQEFSSLSGVHDRTIRSIQFAPIHAPLTLASASFDGSVAIWELPTGSKTSREEEEDWECVAQLEGHNSGTEVKCVRWNGVGSLLATSGRDKSIWIWGSSEGRG